MALAAAGDPENAETMGAIYGEELKLLGINADYAPVMDVNNKDCKGRQNQCGADRRIGSPHPYRKGEARPSFREGLYRNR